MLHFFSVIGRRPWARHIVPLVGSCIPLGYMGFHMIGHNFARDLMAAHSESGKREELSKNLQALIMKTFKEIENDFNKPILQNDVFASSHQPPIKWFASSLAEPITLGMSESKSGIVIGLPNYYNYEKAEDVPENILEVSKIRLFKSWNKEAQNQNEREEVPGLDDPNSGSDNIAKMRIDKNSPEAQQYIESILLSEKAKKFSIARELFMGDSYRPMATSLFMALSIAISICVARAAVIKLRLKDAHLSQRLPFYVLAGSAGFVNYIFLGDSAQRFYCQQADSRAMSVDDSYREGAIEYFNKTIQRNKALRNLIEDLQFSYDEEGNFKAPFFRFKYIPLQERLEAAQKTNSS